MRMPFSRTATTPSQPIETGTVSWLRELNDALAVSTETAKPVFALFQEVPGCAGCQQFGADVLSDPLVVEAIEQLFVPLLIHNNAGGRDAEILQAYGEPAWNFQVVRFLDAHGEDLIPRRDRVWETGPLLTRMVASLRVTGALVPDHLLLLEQEHSSRLESLVLAQSCFWVGEMEIGQIDGVVVTEAGFQDGLEVTQAWFDPDVISADQLAAEAAKRNVASKVFTTADGYRAAPANDQNRQLGQQGNNGRTPAQLTKLNAFNRSSPADAARFLFPSQR